MSKDPIDQAFEEGGAARQAGERLEANPYISGSRKLAVAWENGWRKADDAGRGGKDLGAGTIP